MLLDNFIERLRATVRSGVDVVQEWARCRGICVCGYRPDGTSLEIADDVFAIEEFDVEVESYDSLQRFAQKFDDRFCFWGTG